jgi:hypothetical protein
MDTNGKRKLSAPIKAMARPAMRREAPRPGEHANELIVPANVHALQALYVTAMLEEIRLFDVVERLAVMFSQGVIPVGSGRAGAVLYRYWSARNDRLTAAQRRGVYARAFGFVGGDGEVITNGSFDDLWVRFLSTLGLYAAQVEALPRSEWSIDPEEVRRSGRDLAVNLSAHGHGIAYFAAQELKDEVQEIIDLLSEPEIQSAFGAREPWQVIQRVAVSELGVRPNISRGRTRAESGAIIIRWLASRRVRLLRPRGTKILNEDDLSMQRSAESEGKKPTIYPTDYDLVTACQQWLTVTGTEEAQLTRYARTATASTGR